MIERTASLWRRQLGKATFDISCFRGSAVGEGKKIEKEPRRAFDGHQAMLRSTASSDPMDSGHRAVIIETEWL